MPKILRQLYDIQQELENYQYYGFESEEQFNRSLNHAITKAKLNMSEYLTLDEMNKIESKEYKFLNTQELLIYNAENYFAISEFLKREARLEKQKITINSKNISNSYIGKEKISKDYDNDAMRYLNQAGIDTGVYIDFYENVA